MAYVADWALITYYFLFFCVYASVSPAVVADGGEGSMSFMTTSPVTSRPTVDRPTVDKGNGQFEETQYSDGKVGICAHHSLLFCFWSGFYSSNDKVFIKRKILSVETVVRAYTHTHPGTCTHKHTDSVMQSRH